MTLIMSVTITTAGCSVTCYAIRAQPHARTGTYSIQLDRNTPDIRTGSSSLTVFMELSSICRCSWCVSSCCLSSIIFDILVIPEKKTDNQTDCCYCDREQNIRTARENVCILTQTHFHQTGTGARSRSLLHK